MTSSGPSELTSKSSPSTSHTAMFITLESSRSVETASTAESIVFPSPLDQPLMGALLCSQLNLPLGDISAPYGRLRSTRLSPE